MADGYIESRMEAHRKGTLNSPARRRSAMFETSMPPRRVFITADAPTALTDAMITAYSNAGCRVAFMTPDDDCAARHMDGPRHIDTTKELFAAWDDVDIIVSIQSTGCVNTGSVCAAVSAHRESLPVGNPFGGRLITAGISTSTEPSSVVGMTANHIDCLTDGDDLTMAAAVRTALFLSLTQNASIDGSTIRIR